MLWNNTKNDGTATIGNEAATKEIGNMVTDRGIKYRKICTIGLRDVLSNVEKHNYLRADPDVTTKPRSPYLIFILPLSLENQDSSNI